MTYEDARLLLDRIGVLRRECGLDLLIFFARHPRSLLASETLASFLGYELKEIADSLDVLLAASLVTRAQTKAHPARLYVLATVVRPGGTNDDGFPSLLAVAATREGRLVLRHALERRRRETSGEAIAPMHSSVAAEPRPRRDVQPNGVQDMIELGDAFRLGLTVAKMRANPTTRATFECEILSDGGMRVLPRQLPAGLQPPFSRYQGLISRAPTRWRDAPHGVREDES